MRKLYIHTFGCQMNEHDSLKVISYMRDAGYELTGDPGEADCIILNTCSVREKPQQKVYSALGRLRHLKRRKPELVIGVGGCVAQQEGKRLLERVPHLDFVFGTHQIHMVPVLAQEAQTKSARHCMVDFLEEIPSLNRLARPLEGSVKAYVTIMQGCNNFCSYCIVPYVRGPEKSRSPEEILKEVQDLAEKGVREITLLGQNVNSYGKDRRGYPTFAELLRLLNGVDGICRIRFTTSHPKDLFDELMDAVAELPKVCEHVHLPIQAGSNRILKRMNRGYTKEHYLDKVRRLKEKIPGITLSTDIIVGFPGEEEEDFLETLEVLREVRFAYIYSFKYSPRPNTAAYELEDSVSEDEKARRLNIVQDLQKGITSSILRRCVGLQEEVLIEGPSPRDPNTCSGRTRTNHIVHVEGDLEALKGRLVNVKINRAMKNCLGGRLISVREEVA